MNNQLAQTTMHKLKGLAEKRRENQQKLHLINHFLLPGVQSRQEQTIARIREIYLARFADAPFFPVESLEDFDAAAILRRAGLPIKIRMYRDPLGPTLFQELSAAAYLMNIAYDDALYVGQPARPLFHAFDHHLARRDD